MMQLRGSATSRVLQRLPGPSAMMVKAPGSIRLGFPMRPANTKLTASPSNQFFYKTTAHHQLNPFKQQQRPVVPSYFNKFSSPPQKAAIKFAPALAQPLKAYKPEFVYEKVNGPKFPEPVRFTLNSAIHTIPAPNLSNPKLNEIHHNHLNSLNSQLDKDLTKFVAQGFALHHPPVHEFDIHNFFLFSNFHFHCQPTHATHHYQVSESGANDATIKDTITGHKTFFAPDHDPALKSPHIHPVDDPLSIPSDSKQKPLDVLLYQQNLNFGSGPSPPLVQVPHFSVDPYNFPVTSQPQLQQYQAFQQHQNSMIKHLDPTYLVSQSNNLYNQHQQLLGSRLFTPQGSYYSPVTAQPSLVTINEVASIGQIYSAQKNADASVVSTTFAPSTVPSSYQTASSHDDPVVLTSVNEIEPKPQHYLYSQNNFVDLPEEHLSQNDIQNFLSYDQQAYNHLLNYRQQENDLILREAQEKLKEKLHTQKQQQQTAYDLHQLVQQEKFSPLRIVVPDVDDGVSLMMKWRHSDAR